jgi:GcrA cell cycle regulator
MRGTKGVGNSFDWTPEAVETAKRLWLEGRSASFIAKEFGEPATRNAVIGKLYRLGFQNIRRPIDPDKNPPHARRPPAPNPASVKLRSSFRATPPKTLLARQKAAAKLADRFKCEPAPPRGKITIAKLYLHHCRWPFGDPRSPSFRYCGKPREGESSYCAAHNAIAYVPVRVREAA